MLSKQETSTIFTSYLDDLNEKQIDLLYRYYELIEQKNKVMNLTGFTDEKLVIEGIIESILVLNEAFKLEENKKYKLVDIGAGAGFPSVPFFLVHHEQIELTIIEPLKKRCAFLQEVAQDLKLTINITNQRAEDVKFHEYFDLVTARAVMDLKKLIEVSCQLGKLNSQQVFVKGQNVEKEILESKNIVDKLGLKIENKVFNTKNIRKNNLVSVIKTHSIDKKFPRKWQEIIKDKN
ncbi:16S rRNA (guanine(527)-N(7))-methyltransferase RsmG [[Mycoplasma] gypis]|uniref:Ribosomal RNA small subunit methyltransferase G n=1 Tax=[Mycoplasma] gypis TaxID=92404 RepID=A0ABZ2RPJ6_9BACT|nr:16S rRNA (guanine(527)-N(7))-methyltransferase RsmG [[Mycoplasma] gypis]MBN0919531.1 16S rRNA (guanine(527)-N(7))-methyltransferase RsmG [[Mycoplasma] gypis]